jgi:hypothetical protein
MACFLRENVHILSRGSTEWWRRSIFLLVGCELPGFMTSGVFGKLPVLPLPF